jgi:putative transposase
MTLGVDLGIIQLATDSTGESFSGEFVEQNRKRHHGLRQRLQKRRTKSAKRHLKKLPGTQARFQKNTNHMISKRIVHKAKQQHKAIALKELRHIRSRTEARLRRALADYAARSERGIATGHLDNCVPSSLTRLRLRAFPCKW